MTYVKIMLEEEKEKLGCYVYLPIEEFGDDIYSYHYLQKKCLQFLSNNLFAM